MKTDIRKSLYATFRGFAMSDRFLLLVLRELSAVYVLVQSTSACLLSFFMFCLFHFLLLFTESCISKWLYSLAPTGSAHGQI